MTDEERDLIPEEMVNAAAALAGQQRPVYAGTFEEQLSGIYDKIANREPFEYAVNADPLYQTYKDQYIQGGKLAMKDTMGQAAALTGGYGSTYGQQVGQQAYDAYLQNLTAVIPELYGLAYGKYKDDGDNLKDLYGMAGQMRNNEYSSWRDELADARYDDELAYNRRIAEEETAYNRQQQAYSSLYAIIKASGYDPTDDELASAGMTREAATALRNEYLRANGLAAVTTTSSGGGSGGGGSGGGGGNKKYTLADFEKDVAQARHSNQVQDLYRAYAEAVKAGNTTFTRKQLDAYMNEHHL